jgi:uncharacterized protein (DUF934 family)
MPTLIDRHGLREDRWSWFDPASTVTAPATPPASGTRQLLSLEQWQTHGEALLAAGAEVGICLEPGEGPEALAGILDSLGLVAVRFPAFTDGRGYSTARLLRQRYGWSGELRAVGDVLRDQMFYLARCGFDTFDLKDGESVAEALAGFGDFTEAYQAAVDRGPLFSRRREAAEASGR